MVIYSNVEKALRKRKCKCEKYIEKGTFCFRIKGYQDSQNICPECMKKYTKKITERNKNAKPKRNKKDNEKADKLSELDRYKRAYNILMDYWDYIPDEDKLIVDKALKELNL
jgi:hypothetical protein